MLVKWGPDCRYSLTNTKQSTTNPYALIFYGKYCIWNCPGLPWLKPLPDLQAAGRATVRKCCYGVDLHGATVMSSSAAATSAIIWIHDSWWRHQMKTFSALLAISAGIHRSQVNITHKSQWRGALMFSLICAWINGWVNNEAGDLRRHCAHYDVTAMLLTRLANQQYACTWPMNWAWQTSAIHTATRKQIASKNLWRLTNCKRFR